MTTFKLETCKRLEELLGQPNQITLWWMKQIGAKGKWHVVYGRRGYQITNRFGYERVPAFTLQDLSADVWKDLGEKLGWKFKDSMVWGEEPEWNNHAFHCYDAWLTGGYPEADKYLDSILPK